MNKPSPAERLLAWERFSAEIEESRKGPRVGPFDDEMMEWIRNYSKEKHMNKTILDLFEWIGRKLLRALARGGVAFLLRTMRTGVRRIRKRLRRYRAKRGRLRSHKARFRVERRMQYQEWRLANWRKALRWVESERSEITDRIAKEVHEAAGHIPEIGDTIARWEAA